MTDSPLSERIVSLDYITVIGAPPAEQVEIAARAGYGAISPGIGAGNDRSAQLNGEHIPVFPLRAGEPDTIAMQRRMRDTGVFINNCDGFMLYEGVPMEDLRRGVDLMAEMGARGLVTLQFDQDANRGFEHFCILREWAAKAELPLLIEFTPLSFIPALGDALDYAERAGGDNVRVLVDLLHLHRSGGHPRDLLNVDPAMIRGAQLCDGPDNATREEYFIEALHERMVPGDGELPVREFLAALPSDTIFGVEVPLRSRREAGESHFDRAQSLMARTRALLKEVEALSAGSVSTAR